MVLCQNVYRRGALYWWRRRFVDPAAGRSHTIAISLRVHRPAIARRLGATLNAKASGIANRIGSGMTIDDARKDLVLVVDGATWRLSESALAALDASASNVFESSPLLTRDEQIAVLRIMADDAETEIAHGATANRLRAIVDGSGRPLDPEKEARAGEIALAVIYRAIAEGGRAASLPEGLVHSLVESVGTDVAEFVVRQVAYMAKSEGLDGNSWLLGPSKSYFEDGLRNAGCEASLGAIRLVRRDYLLICATLLEDERRWTKPSVVSEILDGFTAEIHPAKTVVAPVETIEGPPATVSSYRDALMQQALPKSPARFAPRTVTQHVEDLIKSKRRAVDTNGREIPGKDRWDVKTSNQHRSIARMLVKVAETDDPRQMNQAVLGAYRLLLHDLPKNWGKSPSDLDRSIDDIVARAQDCDDHEVGLAGTTIDRHMTQLSNIVEYIASNGVRIGTIGRGMRTGGSNQPRGVFTHEELIRLFRSAVWTGSLSVSERLIPGNAIVQDALYWIPILARYELLRLAEVTGLLVTDIDFDEPAIIIQDNSERRLKSNSARRRQPLVPEVLRLGFLEYAIRMRDAGHTLLFPCLRMRGQKTTLSNLFYKHFKKVLIEILPDAAEHRKSFHSLRKDGNSLMSNANINDPIRHATMGHAHSGVNEKHYLEQIFDEPKIMALSNVPIVTSHLPGV